MFLHTTHCVEGASYIGKNKFQKIFQNFYAFLNKKREHSLKFINYMTTNATSTSSDLTASLHPYIEVRPGRLAGKFFLENLYVV